MINITKPIGERKRLLSKEEAKAMLEIYEAVGKRIQDKNPVSITYDSDYFVIDDFVRKDANGNIIEQYDKLGVMNDVVRYKTETYNNNTQPRHKSKTPYLWTTVFEKQENLWLPSSATLAGIMICLFRKAVEKGKNGNFIVVDEKAARLLEQFKDYGKVTGWHACNTVFIDNKIIHYPGTDDYPGIYTNNINQKLDRKVLPFNRVLELQYLGNFLRSDKGRMNIINFTGEYDEPEILLDIGKYFKRTPIIHGPLSRYIRACWFGCDSRSLELYAVKKIHFDAGARGVCKIKCLT